jgi:hypothetical protein
MKKRALLLLAISICFGPQILGQKSQPKQQSQRSVLDVRPKAICEREMEAEFANDEADKSYFYVMELDKLKRLRMQSMECIPRLSGIPARKAITVLQTVSFSIGLATGLDYEEQKQNEQQKQANDDRESLINQYQTLAKNYDDLILKYNGLVRDHNQLIISTRNYMTTIDGLFSQLRNSRPTQTVPVFLPPPAEPIHCSAFTMGSTTSINCR